MIAIKKMIASSLVELKCRVDEWVAHLNKNGEDTARVNIIRKEYRPLLDRAEDLRGIRNIGFHFLDLTLEADDLTQVYEEIEKVDIGEMNEILKAILNVGQAAKEITQEKTE